MKKLFSFFTLLIFIIVGFLHNSMMSFAMQSNMHKEMMWNMKMHCCDDVDSNNCEHSCYFSWNSDFKIITLNNTNFQKKILKIKIINFYDIFWKSSEFLENKNLINNTSPPNLQNKIKYYSYSDLVKIIKSNT